jgi:hypothetical protein
MQGALRRRWQGSDGQNSLNESSLVVQIYATISSMVLEVGWREMRCKGIRDFEGTDAGRRMEGGGSKLMLKMKLGSELR